MPQIFVQPRSNFPSGRRCEKSLQRRHFCLIVRFERKSAPSFDSWNMAGALFLPRHWALNYAAWWSGAATNLSMHSEEQN
jgi:hypothetical protein